MLECTQYQISCHIWELRCKCRWRLESTIWQGRHTTWTKQGTNGVWYVHIVISLKWDVLNECENQQDYGNYLDSSHDLIWLFFHISETSYGVENSHVRYLACTGRFRDVNLGYDTFPISYTMSFKMYTAVLQDNSVHHCSIDHGSWCPRNELYVHFPTRF